MAKFLSSSSSREYFGVLRLLGVVRCSVGDSSARSSSEHLRTVEKLGIRTYSTSEGQDGPTSKKQHTLTFEEYRKLKKSIKIRTRIAGIPMAFVGIGTSSAVTMYLNPRMFEMTPEEVQPILGMDPIMVATLCGMVSGVMGYLAGGAIFRATWKLVSRAKFQELEWRDEDFLKRLQKHRFTGVNKYEDDYYGDKISTLSDYRQWIRQQQKRKESIEPLKTAGKESDET